MIRSKNTNTLLRFHPILKNLSKDLHILAQQGIELMKKSKDPMHTIEHTKELFDLYQKLRNDIFKTHKLDKKQENALLLALIWHDVYKATQVHPNNALYFLYDQAVEGKLSANIFLKATENTSIPKEILDITVHAIKYHATLAVWMRGASHAFNQVADIILDLDTLENMNPKRIKRAAEKVQPFYLIDYWFSYHAMRFYTKMLASKHYRLPFMGKVAKQRAEEFLLKLPQLRSRKHHAFSPLVK